MKVILVISPTCGTLKNALPKVTVCPWIHTLILKREGTMGRGDGGWGKGRRREGAFDIQF